MKTKKKKIESVQTSSSSSCMRDDKKEKVQITKGERGKGKGVVVITIRACKPIPLKDSGKPRKAQAVPTAFQENVGVNATMVMVTMTEAE